MAKSNDEVPKNTRVYRGTLTQKMLEALTPEHKGMRLYDGHSLRGIVRVGLSPPTDETGFAPPPKISVFFVWRYVLDGKQREFYCGTWNKKSNKKSLADIRKTRTEAEALKDKGIDPAHETQIKRQEKRIDKAQRLAGLNEKEAAIAAYKARPTFLEVYERWLLIGLAKRKSTDELQRGFSKDVLPILGKMAIADITRAHVASVLDTILARGSSRLATRTLSELRQLFGFAIDRECLENDPTYRLKKKDFGGQDTERDRVLSEEELQALARQLPTANLYRPTETAIWLMLATGCRIGELTAAKWEDIDPQAGVWRIPAPKNKKPHTIYLSGFALDQLQELRALHADTAWLYPHRITRESGIDSVKGGPLDSKAITRQIKDRQRLEVALSKRTQATTALCLIGGPWTPHDLRRTAATMMGRLGVRPDVIERCLNHVEPNRIKRTYQRQELRTEQAEAWRILGERLELLRKTADSAHNLVLGRFGKAAA